MGPRGEQGPSGPTGPPGPQGPNGLSLPGEPVSQLYLHHKTDQSEKETQKLSLQESLSMRF